MKYEFGEVSILGYEPSRTNEILNCLKRNFDANRNKSIETLHREYKNLFEYDFGLDAGGFRNGMMIVHDGNVVGYLWGIFSQKKIGNKNRTVLNPSAVAIDNDYRAWFFKAAEIQYDMADLVYETTAIPSVKEIDIKLFGFESIDSYKIRFDPVETQTIPHLIIKELSTEDYSWMPSSAIKEIEDHSCYGIRAVCVCDTTRGEYDDWKKRSCIVIYHIMDFNGKWIRVLKLYNSKLFALNAFEVVDRLYKMEIGNKGIEGGWCRLECDLRFFDGEKICHPNYDLKSVNRLLLNKTGEIVNIDNLYTEQIIVGAL